jgi:ribonuclease HI
VTLCLRELDGFLLCEVMIGEAVGLHTALQWVSDLRFDNVNLVLDSQQVIDSFHIGVDDDSKLGCIITACRQLFQDSFQNSHVEFNRR